MGALMVASNARHDERQRSMRWCPSCQAIVYTEWDECKGHQTRRGPGVVVPDAPFYGCGAVLKPTKPKVFDAVAFPRPTGTISTATLLAILNNSGFRPRKQKVNLDTAATPFGGYVDVPHTTECPLCKSALIHGIYVTTKTDGAAELEIACAQCATSRIPFRQFFGVRVVKHCVLWATIAPVAADAWIIQPVEAT